MLTHPISIMWKKQNFDQTTILFWDVIRNKMKMTFGIFEMRYENPREGDSPIFNI